MGLITDHTYQMLRHMSNDNEGADFSLYPDPTQFTFNALQNFEMENNSPYTFPRPQESWPASTDFNTTAMYAEASQYPIESPELRAVPSNYSTASGPSAASSAMGSPHSIHGHSAPAPEWAPHGLGLNPSIVGFDSFGNGSEYNFNAISGTDDFALDLGKPNGFVGECENVTRSACHNHSLVSSDPESLTSFPTCMPSPKALDMVDQKQDPASSRSMASPVTPFNASRKAEDFISPTFSSISRSPLSLHRPVQAFDVPSSATSSSASWSQSSPLSAVSQSSFLAESSAQFSTFNQSPFFFQSSGAFVPPLESSCSSPVYLALSAIANGAAC